MNIDQITPGLQVNYPPIGDCEITRIDGYYYLQPLTEEGWGNAYQRYKYGHGLAYGKRCGRVMPMLTEAIIEAMTLPNPKSRPTGQAGEILVVGIDPGTHTGFAVKDLATGKFIMVITVPIHQAWGTMNTLIALHGKEALRVVVEDARQRKWIDKSEGREKLQGVGSVKRDCTIWDDYLADLGIPYRMVKPAAHRTKWNAKVWQAATGWTGRTSEHARDAAILVHGINEINIKTLTWKTGR
jgi:hypothetical protein